MSWDLNPRRMSQSGAGFAYQITMSNTIEDELDDLARSIGLETTDTDESAGVDADAVEPAVSTYVWSATGGECAACGATVDRRWRQDDELVCPECKEW